MNFGCKRKWRDNKKGNAEKDAMNYFLYLQGCISINSLKVQLQQFIITVFKFKSLYELFEQFLMYYALQYLTFIKGSF